MNKFKKGDIVEYVNSTNKELTKILSRVKLTFDNVDTSGNCTVILGGDFTYGRKYFRGERITTVESNLKLVEPRKPLKLKDLLEE